MISAVPNVGAAATATAAVAAAGAAAAAGDDDLAPHPYDHGHADDHRRHPYLRQGRCHPCPDRHLRDAGVGVDGAAAENGSSADLVESEDDFAIGHLDACCAGLLVAADANAVADPRRHCYFQQLRPAVDYPARARSLAHLERKVVLLVQCG